MNRWSKALVLSLLALSMRAYSDEHPAASPSKLPVYELKMKRSDLAALERSGYSNDTHPATFLSNGELYENVRVRYRGEWARSWPKKPLKIFFNEDKLFGGQRCLNLNSAWRDPAFVREQLAYEIYSACGVPASRSRMVRLQVNGQFYGLYVEVEQPDKPFLRRFDLKGALVYKAVSHSNQADERDLRTESLLSKHYEMETHKSEGFGALQQFCAELASTRDVGEFFARRVDVDEYINYLAATALVQNWDCFNKNHFIVYDRHGSKKWLIVPWDLDRTLGDHWRGPFDHARLPVLLGTRQLPGVTGWNRMADRFLNDRGLRIRFLKRLDELLQKEFTAEKLVPILDRLEAAIAPEAALDHQRWPSGNPNLHRGIAQVKNYIEERRTYLLNEVAALRRE